MSLALRSRHLKELEGHTSEVLNELRHNFIWNSTTHRATEDAKLPVRKVKYLPHGIYLLKIYDYILKLCLFNLWSENFTSPLCSTEHIAENL